MRFIPTKVHGALDYAVGTIMTSTPLLNFIKDKEANAILLGSGIGVTTYSMLTDYELGAKRLIPMKWHLTMDFIDGAFIALSPWLFKFEKSLRVPFVLTGVMEMALALFTQTEPENPLTGFQLA